jgi:trimethylamine--corrinoid protein Co-methyltransferase
LKQGGTFLLNCTWKPEELDEKLPAAILPKVASREMRGRWEDEGRPDADARALQEAKRILSKENQARFPAELDKVVRSHFTGLVPGDAHWYD